MKDDQSVLSLSDDVLKICARYWKSGKDGPAPTCCRGCPLMSPCHAGCVTTVQGIKDHVARLNEAAEQLSAPNVQVGGVS